MSSPRPFSGGRNIAIKVPPHQYEATVAFYRDVLGLTLIEDRLPEICFEFGDARLWIDNVAALSQSEIWLELRTDDRAAAIHHLAANGIIRRDEIEPLPESSDGFWIASPSNIIHLVSPPG